RRVDARGGRGPRRLAHRRGPGLPRPSGVLVRDAGAHPRLDPARHGHGPQARHGAPRLRPPPGGALPDREAARLHQAPRAGRGARRAVEGRGHRPEHHALPERRRRATGHRRNRRRDRAADRRSGPVRCGPALAGSARRRRRAALGRPRPARARRLMAVEAARAGTSLSLRHEVLRLALRDPFLISRSDHGGGHAATTVVVELRDERHPGLVGLGEGYPDNFYGETPETMAAVWPLLLNALGDPSLGDREDLADASRRMQQAIRWNGAAKCALDIALFDLAGKVTGDPVHELLGLSAEIPPTDFSLGIDEPDVVAQRAERAGAF